jgi:hypothetical protein
VHRLDARRRRGCRSRQHRRAAQAVRSFSEQATHNFGRFSQVDGVRSAIYNSISHITRLNLTFEDSGDYVDPIKQCFVNLDDGPFFLSVSFDEGAHMIALAKEDDVMVLFDPNFGVFQADDNVEVEDLAEALFAEYAALAMTIKSWRVFSLELAESALDRFKRISGAT